MHRELYMELWGSSKESWHSRFAGLPNLFCKSLNETKQIFPNTECIYFPLEKTLDNYGFLDTDIVNLRGPKEPLKIDLNAQSRLLYEEFRNADQMPATRFAQLAGDIINSTMRYEFSIIKNKHSIRNDVAEAQYYTDAQKNYTPPKNYTLSGICEDAAFFIDALIHSRRPEYPYRKVLASLHDYSLGTHSVVLFYSDERWTLINALSPTNTEPLIRKEALKDGYITFNDGALVKGKIILPEV